MMPRKANFSNLFIKGLLGLLIFLIPCLAMATGDDPVTLPSWAPKLLGLQATGIYQYMPSFTSPYDGAKSLTVDNGLGRQLTQTYGIYLGSKITPSFQAFLDVEWFIGHGLSNGYGLGGFPNGDVIRAGPSNLGNDPYLARLYFKYNPTSEIEIRAGKMAPTDNMDLNRYANNQRTQFLNYAFLFNTAWDYASDTRGYSYGFSVALDKKSWGLTWSSYMTPGTANGYNLDTEVYRARGDNLEFTLKPNDAGTIIRFLTFLNEGRMGDYREALNTAIATSTTPNITANESPGRIKYGFCINLEQPLADQGETGFFARAGISDGNTSAWSYTDADRHLSAGFQVSGIRWNRNEDRFGIAYSVQGLSGPHEEYLAAGGMGMVIGDGKLNYGLERILETYYRIQLGRYVQVSPDFQYIENPGYNQDRGPVKIYGLRVRLFY